MDLYSITSFPCVGEEDLNKLPGSIHSIDGSSWVTPVYLRGHPPRVTSSKKQLGVNPPSAQDPPNSLTNTKLSQTP